MTSKIEMPQQLQININVGDDPEAFTWEQVPGVIREIADRIEAGKFQGYQLNGMGNKAAKYKLIYRERLR